MTNRHFALIIWILLLLLAGIRTTPAAELQSLRTPPLNLSAE